MDPSTRRLQTVSRHLAAGASKTGTKSPDDVVVVWAKRTAIGRARKGSFRDTTPDTLLAAVLEAAVSESGVPYSALGDICVGNCQLGGSYAGPARMAMFVAGFPETVRPRK
jgi:acetyl-CoA acyltransferase 1